MTLRQFFILAPLFMIVVNLVMMKRSWEYMDDENFVFAVLAMLMGAVVSASAWVHL